MLGTNALQEHQALRRSFFGFCLNTWFLFKIKNSARCKNILRYCRFSFISYRRRFSFSYQSAVGALINLRRRHWCHLRPFPGQKE